MITTKKDLITEEEAKIRLGISDFRSIKKDQLIEFVSMIPEMDKEVAKACIDQFPNFKEYSNAIVKDLYSLMNAAIKEDSKGSIDAYKKILDELQSILDKKRVSKRERKYIINKMIEIANKIETIDDKKRDLTKKILQAGAAVASLAITAGAAILGIKFYPKK